MKQLDEHNKRRSEAITNITSKRMKGSSMWTSGTKTASNLDFEHPGDDKDVELAQLWELQEEIPTVTVTRSMVDAAIEAIWDQHILSQPAVDFCIDEYDKVMHEFDDKINKCRQLNYKNDLAVRIKAKYGRFYVRKTVDVQTRIFF